MKGLKIDRARPSNAIDIYALLKEAQKERVLYGDPSERQLQSYFFGGLIAELSSPLHLFFVAKRGRGFLGFVHAVLIPGRWDGFISHAVIDTIFVTKKRRKNGIGRKLLDDLKKEVENIGIKRLEFLASDPELEYWAKERGAAKIKNLAGVDL